MIGQIRRLAASEPAAFGIDTRIRIANVLPESYDARAVELLRDDESELAGIADSDEQSALRVRIAAAWARFDLEQAERSIQPLRRTEQHDYPAEAYDQLYIRFEQQPELGRAVVTDGLKAGAFRMTAASRLLDGFANKDRAAAVTLFAAMIQAFPSTSCFPADVIYLLDQVKVHWYYRARPGARSAQDCDQHGTFGKVRQPAAEASCGRSWALRPSATRSGSDRELARSAAG